MKRKILIKLILIFNVVIFSISCATFSQTWRYIKQNDLTVDPSFSINLSTPQRNWPNEKKLSPQEKEAYKKYGRPDFVRIWWDKRGKLMTQKEVGEKLKKTKGNYKTFKKSWIYIDKEREIIFPQNDTFKEQPLTDKLTTVTEYGDPQEIKMNIVIYDDMKCDRWTYWSQGKHFDFVGDKLVKTHDFAPMGGTFPRM